MTSEILSFRAGVDRNIQIALESELQTSTVYRTTSQRPASLPKWSPKILRKAAAISVEKFHTDDVNLPRILLHSLA